MKVATVSVAGGRRVGQIAKEGTSTAPFALARSQAQDGMLALIGRNGAGPPRKRSPRPPIDIANTPVRCSINGERRPRSNTGLLVFDSAKLIRTLSAGVRLQPGSAVATATRAGAGIDLPKYRDGGDVVRLAIGGVLANEIVERIA